jgi:23S rRNA G2069 N7-methylase RlmK/C1962 C5-methylase RlmI
MDDAQNHEEIWAEQAQMLANRLRKKQRHLRKWAKRNQITCYRVYHLDVPEIPFSIDRYNDKLYVSEWKRRRYPHEPEQHPLWIEWMLETICETLEVDRSDLFLKQRERKKGKSQYEKVSTEQHRMLVEESGLKFWVNLSDYLDTGLFLDHRNTRQMVREEAEGKRVLNLFAYTGSFTVYAAAGGATHTTTVDMSKTYLHWAHDNLEANELDGRQHRLIHSDVFAFLKDEARNREEYDLIVLDPPTYSASKRMEGTLDVQRDHFFMIRRCLELLSPGGVLYFSTNFRKFSLDDNAVRAAASCEEITNRSVPEDFKHSQIHRCWRITMPLEENENE